VRELEDTIVTAAEALLEGTTIIALATNNRPGRT
jgi:hypothetical protein